MKIEEKKMIESIFLYSAIGCLIYLVWDDNRRGGNVLGGEIKREPDETIEVIGGRFVMSDLRWKK